MKKFLFTTALITLAFGIGPALARGSSHSNDNAATRATAYPGQHERATPATPGNDTAADHARPDTDADTDADTTTDTNDNAAIPAQPGDADTATVPATPGNETAAGKVAAHRKKGHTTSTTP